MSARLPDRYWSYEDQRWIYPNEERELARESAACRAAWAWTVRWLEMQGGTVLAEQVVVVMQSRLRQEMAK